jgi:hypothetical protein
MLKLLPNSRKYDKQFRKAVFWNSIYNTSILFNRTFTNITKISEENLMRGNHYCQIIIIAETALFGPLPSLKILQDLY